MPLPLRIAPSPTEAVLCTRSMFTPTAAATPVSASVLVAVEMPWAAPSASLCASTVSWPLPLIVTPPATLAVLWVFM